MIFVLLFCLALIAYVRTKNAGKLQRMFEALLNARMVKQRSREEGLFSERFSIFLSVNHWLMLAMSIYFFVKLYHPSVYQAYEFHLYWMLLFLIFVVYFCKTVFLSLVDALFDKNYGSGEYLRNVFIFNRSIGLALLLLNILMAFLPSGIANFILIISGIIVIIFVILRYFRGFIIGRENRAYFQYLFLYLCLLEILPTAMVFKLAATVI